jgi:hypothetical protein
MIAVVIGTVIFMLGFRHFTSGSTIPVGSQIITPSETLTPFEDGSLGVTLLHKVEIGESAQPRSWTLKFPPEFEPALNYSLDTITFGKMKSNGRLSSSATVFPETQFLNITLNWPDMSPVDGVLTPDQPNSREKAKSRIYIMLTNSRYLEIKHFTASIANGICILGPRDNAGLQEIFHGKTLPTDKCGLSSSGKTKVYALIQTDKLAAIINRLTGSDSWNTEVDGWTLSWDWLQSDSLEGRDAHEKILKFLDKHTIKRSNISDEMRN